MKAIKKFIVFSLAAILFLSTFVLTPVNASAWEEGRVDRTIDVRLKDLTTWSVYREGDYLVIDNYDQKRTSKYGYRTIGFTLSRCKRGVELDQNHPYDMLYNGTATEWIALGIYEDSIIEDPEYIKTLDNKIVDHTRWKIPLSNVYQTIVACYGASSDWAAEVKAAYIDKTLLDPVYLKFDSIMVTVKYDDVLYPDGIEEGKYNFNGKRVAVGTCYTNTPPESSNPQGPTRLKNIGWKNPSTIDFHYNRFFSSLETTPPAPVTPDPSIYYGAAQHVYDTLNYSTEFNISKAIPAGEEVTNMVMASSFNGSVKVEPKSESKEYTITRTFYTKESTQASFSMVGDCVIFRLGGELDKCDPGEPGSFPAYYGGWLGSTVYFKYVGAGKGHYASVPAGDYSYIGGKYIQTGPYTGYYKKVGEASSGKEVDLETVTYKFKATAYYQALTQCNIAAIDSVTVYNNAFPGGCIVYDTSRLSNHNVTLNNEIHTGSHCTFADISSIVASKRIETTRAGLENAKTTEKQNIIKAIGEGIYAKNDKLEVVDNGITQKFMSDTSVQGGTVTDTTLNVTYSVGEKASEKSGVAYGTLANGNLTNFINNLKAKRSQAMTTVTIPVSTQNLDFPTGIKVTYREIQNSSVTQDYVAGKNFFASGDSIYDHVPNSGLGSEHNGGDPDDGYPIRVHTPVVAPIKIVFNDLTDAIENTQLVTSAVNLNANFQLLVDRQYYLEWDNSSWFSQIYGTVEGYENVFDRYVSKKMMRFPFTVVYNGVCYETLNTGYTPWILVQEPFSTEMNWNVGLTDDDIKQYKSVNHWQMTPFYIPSFANDIGWAGTEKYVEVAVYARNFNSSDLANGDVSVDVIRENSEKTQYIATSKRQVQLSGWIYDFSVVGTTNSAMYTGNNLDSKDIFSKNAPFSFAKIRSELKVGTKNRLGTPNIRALADGMYFPSPLDLKQQIPLRNGASLAFSNLGEVWLGQPFAFTLKTMGSLNGKNDSIHIEPSFRYITENGEVLDSKNGEMKMYVVTDNGKTMDIREFDPTDTSLYRPNAISLNDGMFEESFYDGTDSFVGPTGHYLQVGNWATNTANQENALNAAAGYFGSSVSAADIMSRKTYSYNLNHIKIPSTLRYMAGEYEQLQMNDGKMYDRNTSTNTLLTYWDTIANYTTTTETKFINSIQQWQSAYVVPTNIYIVDTRTVGGAAFDIMDYIENQTQFSWSTDPIVESKNGKLIIGFDILAYKNGAPYLTYGGGGNNMWLTEEPSTKEGIEPPVPPVPPVPPIIPDETEVVVVNMGKKITDYVEPGIQNIN